jgi:hypothetical protein
MRNARGTANGTLSLEVVASPTTDLRFRGEPRRERSAGTAYVRLINGDRGGYAGYAMWRRYLKLAHDANDVSSDARLPPRHRG